MNQLSNRSNYELSEQQQQKIKEGQQMLASPVASEETIIWHGHRSWAPTIFGVIVSSIFAFVWFWIQGQIADPQFYPEVMAKVWETFQSNGVEVSKALKWATYTLYAFSGLCLFGILKKILRQINTTYTITSQRVIIKEGIIRVSGGQMGII